MWQRLLGGIGLRAALNKQRQRKGAYQDDCRRRAFFEPLEERKVLATLFLNAGTSGDDQIDISGSGTDLLVLRNGTQIFSGSVSTYSEVQINGADGDDNFSLHSLPSGSSASPTVSEAESNNDLLTAQNLDGAGWHVDPPGSPDPQVDDEGGNRSGDEHVTVLGTGDGTVDVFSFTVVVGASPVNLLFDIDNTSSFFDSYIELLDESGTVLASNDDTPFPDEGSQLNPFDSFISYTIGAAGTYHWSLRVDSFDLTGVPSGAAYELQVVIPGHEIPGGDPPAIVVNGEAGSDTLNVAAALMPVSATEFNVVSVGPAAAAGTLTHGLEQVVSYTGVETFHGGAVYRVLTDLVVLGVQDTLADTTYIRNNLEGTKLLIDVNAATYFSGNLDQLLIAAVNGSADADTILVQNTAVAAHVDGRDGDDTITTAEAPDIVYGSGGNDTISTHGGADYVAGGEGNDSISGGEGDDSLHGNGGDDLLAGDDGNDVVSGGAGSDQVSGQQGQDILIGGSGADHVQGNKDRDLLFAAGVVIQEISGPVSLGDSDSSEFGDANYFRLQNLRQDWLDVVALALTFQAFDAKYDSTADDGVEDTLQGGHDDDAFITDGTAKVVDSAFDRETSS